MAEYAISTSAAPRHSQRARRHSAGRGSGGAHHHQLAYGNGEVDTAALGQVAQQAGAGSTADVVHLRPVQPYAAPVGQLAGEHLKQRGFVATVVAHHGHNGRRGDAQKKVADQHPTGVARNQILHAKRSGSCEC